MDLIKLLKSMDRKLSKIGFGEEEFLGGERSYAQFEGYAHKFLYVMQHVYEKTKERFLDHLFIRQRELEWKERFYLGVPSYAEFDDHGI